MGPGWYGAAVQDESRPDTPQPEARPPAPTSAKGDRTMRGSRFFSSVDASLLGLGTQMLSEVVAGVLLGLGLDHVLGTPNRWVVVGSIVGVAVAMATVIRLAFRPQSPRRQPPGCAPGSPARPGTADPGQAGPSKENPKP
jgi:hypothetical protein